MKNKIEIIGISIVIVLFSSACSPEPINPPTASSSPKWFTDLVRNVSKKYNLRKEVVPSSLDNEPYF